MRMVPSGHANNGSPCSTSDRECQTTFMIRPKTWNGLYAFKVYRKLFGICLITSLKHLMKHTVGGTPSPEGPFQPLQGSYLSPILAPHLLLPSKWWGEKVINSPPTVNRVFKTFLLENGFRTQWQESSGIWLVSPGLHWIMRASRWMVINNRTGGPPVPRRETETKRLQFCTERVALTQEAMQTAEGTRHGLEAEKL